MKIRAKIEESLINRKKYKKTHPYSILRHLKISVILILLSVLQQVLYRPQNIIAIIGSLGFNALYVIVILFYYLSTYGNLKYYIDDNGVFIREGVFFHRSYYMGYDKIHTIVFYRDWLSSLFGAEKVSLDTLAGFRRKFDIEGYVSRRSARSFREAIHRDHTVQVYYRSHVGSLILMSVFWANPITGLIFVVPVIDNISKIIGKEAANNMVKNSIHAQWAYYIRFISPAAATLIAVILLSWVISMLLCLLRHFGLCTYRLNDYIVIVRGFISHSMTYTKLREISSVNIDQSLFMKLLRLKSCSVSVVGSGKMQGDRGLIIAAEKSEELYPKMTMLTGFDYQEIKTLSVAKRSIWAYIYLPLLTLSLPVGLLILRCFLVKLQATILLLATIFFLVIVWWLLFRIFAYKKSHIGFNRQTMIICCFNHLMLRKYYIPFKNIQKIEIDQSLFQRRSGKCNVKVYLFFEKRAVCRIKQVYKKDFLAMLKEQNRLVYASKNGVSIK